MGMYHFNLFVEPERMKTFRELSRQTGRPMAELMRWAWDKGITEENLNERFPQFSGQLSIEGGRL